MKPKELHNKSENELSKLLVEKEEELRKFNFDITGSKVKNMKAGRELRKDIARILTVLRTLRNA